MTNIWGLCVPEPLDNPRVPPDRIDVLIGYTFPYNPSDDFFFERFILNTQSTSSKATDDRYYVRKFKTQYFDKEGIIDALEFDTGKKEKKSPLSQAFFISFIFFCKSIFWK